MSFILQIQKNEANTHLCLRISFQKFLVNGFTMMEYDKLYWLRKNQSTLWVGKYKKFNNKGSTSTTQQLVKKLFFICESSILWWKYVHGVNRKVWKPVKVDCNYIREIFVRVCVEINLTKPVIGKVWMWQHHIMWSAKVFKEFAPLVSFDYYSHMIESARLR